VVTSVDRLYSYFEVQWKIRLLDLVCAVSSSLLVFDFAAKFLHSIWFFLCSLWDSTTRCSVFDFCCWFFIAASINSSSQLLGLLVRAPGRLSFAHAAAAFILELKLFESISDFCLPLLVPARSDACDTVSRVDFTTILIPAHLSGRRPSAFLAESFAAVGACVFLAMYPAQES
jgi:hypothetical protein